MAERRMFAKTVIESDAFLDLPISTRLLYFDLGMRGDDDGFVDSPKRIMRITGASEDDLKLLIAKQFLIPFDSGVVVVRHWAIHNYIRPDRYKPTQYQQEKNALSKEESGAYTLCLPSGIPSGNHVSTMCLPSGYITEQNRIEDNISPIPDGMSDIVTPKRQRKKYDDSDFNRFWEAYPRKVSKEDTLKAWKKLNIDTDLLDTILSAIEKAKATEQWQDQGGKFIPYPASWLNGKRWTDEVETDAEQGERWKYLDG